jgi:uncharacterized protein (DUF2236 family)
MAWIGAALGVPDPPRTEAELAARITAYRAELAGTAQAREAARFLLLTPPLPPIARAPYTVLAAAAVSLLPGWGRRPLHLPRLPATEVAVVRPAGHALFHVIRWAITAPRPTPASWPSPRPAKRPPSRRTLSPSVPVDRYTVLRGCSPVVSGVGVRADGTKKS